MQARLNGGRPGSLSVSSVKMLEAYALILEKVDRSLPLSDAQRQLVRARTLDVKARCLVEQGKSQLLEGRFAQARELFAEANRSLHKWKIAWPSSA